MPTTTSPEEIEKQENVDQFISIHIQRAKKIVVTRVENQEYEYLGEATYDDPP